MTLLSACQTVLGDLSDDEVFRWGGEVTEMRGLVIRSRGPAAGVGDFCEIRTDSGHRVPAHVVGFQNDDLLLMALEEPEGLKPGNEVILRGGESKLAVGPGLLGRVLDGLGHPIDGGPPINPDAFYPLRPPLAGPMGRKHITDPLATGVRVIDAMLTCGKGQRIGIFGGSGVGKSTLLGSMCRHNFADVTVVCLVGERNREVREFIDRDLGPDGLAKSVVIAATSDKPASLRVNACFVACTVAEYFRDQGADVLLVMDSTTRLAMAQREIGLAAGEPPSQKGYTPSVFQLLPRIFERAGNFPKGSITGFFTVLVEGDDFNEPICDATRSILDGHIVLSRKLAAANHYPAIDVLESISRLASHLADKKHWESAIRLRQAMALYRTSEDLIQLGAYVSGSSPQVDACIRESGGIREFLCQSPKDRSTMENSIQQLTALAARLSA